MREEIDKLTRRALYIGVGAMLFITAGMIGNMFKLPYMTDLDSFVILAIVCFLAPPVLWPTLCRLWYVAFTEIEERKQEDDYFDEYLKGHTTFQSKELEMLKKKYDTPTAKVKGGLR